MGFELFYYVIGSVNRSGKSQFLGHNNLLICEKAKSVGLLFTSMMGAFH